jgi:dihydropyrimidinase
MEEDGGSMNILLIKNGTIVTSADTFRSDILLVNGLITRIEPKIEPSNADKVINADGLFVFPGGVDPHVHMHLQSPAGYTSDNFLTGSRAALYGGTTTIIDFVTPHRGQSLTEALERRKEDAKDCMTDFSFHVSPVEWRITTENEIKECILEGISSFKVYMAYKDSVGLDDSDIYKVMKVVGKAGKIVTVHSESGDDIENLKNKLLAENNYEPYYHPFSRPGELEAEAVRRAIYMAHRTNCTLYIVHVSSMKSLKHIRAAQSGGQNIFAETCPQYLVLDDTKYDGEFDQTAPYIMSPPLRKRIDNEELWRALSTGIIKTIGTDHCPFDLSQKRAGINDFRKIPNGAGGVEHRLELLYTYGVIENEITINQMVDLISTQPAKIFGLYPSKGEISVGSDGDLVIWDPDSERTISVKTHHQNCDNNIYEGIKTRGAAKYVIVGGKIVIEDGIMIDSNLKGRFLKR